MGVDYKVSQIYDAGMKQVVSSEKDWKSVCRLTGRLYRYEFDNILMIYMQRPNATLVADYDTWKDPRVGRYVKRGSRGIAIFPPRALKPHMRYVFDISDTGGRETRLTWELDEEKRQAYAACAILIIIIGGVCFTNSTSYLKIEQNIEKITIRNGNTGESIDVTSSKEINNLISQINSLELKKEHKISSGTGWEIMLNIYFAKNEKISSFVIRNNGIEYNNYFYGTNDESQKLLNLLETMFL